MAPPGALWGLSWGLLGVSWSFPGSLPFRFSFASTGQEPGNGGIDLSIYQSIGPLVYRYFDPSSYRSVYRYVYLSMYACTTIYLYICTSIRWCFYISIHLYCSLDFLFSSASAAREPGYDCVLCLSSMSTSLNHNIKKKRGRRSIAARRTQ